MELSNIQNAQAQLRRIYKYLGEAIDLTRQLAEAVERNDQVTIQMVLGMRGEPLREAVKARDALRQQAQEASPAEGERLRALLGGGPARTEEEKGLADQVAANRRLQEQLQQMDEVVNRKLTRERSFYNK